MDGSHLIFKALIEIVYLIVIVFQDQLYINDSSICTVYVVYIRGGRYKISMSSGMNNDCPRLVNY